MADERARGANQTEGCVEALREPPPRRVSVTEDIVDKQGNTIAVTVGFHDCHCGCGASVPVEVFVSKRTKTGTAFDKLLYKLGIAVSKIMQNQP